MNVVPPQTMDSLPSQEFPEDKKRALWESLRLQNELEQAESLCSRWLAICPSIYAQPLDYGRLKHRERVREIVEWLNFPRGRFVSGPTGVGKTRSCWAAIHPRWLDGRSVLSRSAFQVSRDALAATNDHEQSRAIVGRYLSPDILFLDDFAKRMTPATAQFVFEIVERRTSAEKALIFTSNETLDSLSDLIGDGTLAKPLIRRIREFCDVIVLA